MNTRWKNAVGVIIIVILSALIVAGAVVSALGNNSNQSEKEIFIDVAPIDYTAEENVVAVRRFHSAVANYFSQISQTLSLQNFADRVVLACSRARIPAYKLNVIADVIHNYEPTEILSALNNDSSITEDQIIALFAMDTPLFAVDIMHALFTETDLTGEEFGRFVYEYLNEYGSVGYKSALSAVGKDVFIDFVGSASYFISQLKDYNNGSGKLTDSAAFVSACYQMGTVAKAMASVSSVTNVEKVLGFDWSFDPSIAEYNALMTRITELRGKFVATLNLLGMVLRNLSYDSVDKTFNAETQAQKAAATITLAKDIKYALDTFVDEYGTDLNIGSLDELKAMYIIATDDIYYSMKYVSNSDVTNEQFLNSVSGMHDNYEKLFGALTYLSALNYDESAINALDEGTRTDLYNKCDDFAALSYDSPYILESILYLWGSARLYELA